MKFDLSPLSEPLDKHGKLVLCLMLFMTITTAAVAATVDDVMIVIISFVVVFVISISLYCLIASK